MHSFKIQRGLSLIELMVGLVLAALLLLGVLQIFDGNRRTHTLQESFSRVQESGRIATDLLAQELRNAAFDGCAGKGAGLENLNATTAFDWDFSNGVNGTDNVSANLVIDGKTVVQGTDVLTVRGAVDACGGRGRIVSSAGGLVTIAGSCPQKTGNLILRANCQGGEISTVSADTSATSISIAVAPPFSSKVYGPEAKIYRPYVRQYFIHNDNNAGPGLYMSENGSGAQELVPGVEDLQLSFGRATGSNDVVDIWGAAPAPPSVPPPPPPDTDSLQIAAVRLQIVVAAPERSGTNPFEYARLNETVPQIKADGHLRKQYLVMTKVRNRGAR